MVDKAQKKEALLWIKRGLAALKAKDRKKARQYLLKARELDPENADVWVYLTGTTPDPQKRRMLLDRALSIDPQNKQARRALQKLNLQIIPHFEDEQELPPPPPAHVPPPPPPPTVPEMGVVPDAAVPVDVVLEPVSPPERDVPPEPEPELAVEATPEPSAEAPPVLAEAPEPLESVAASPVDKVEYAPVDEPEAVTPTEDALPEAETWVPLAPVEPPVQIDEAASLAAPDLAAQPEPQDDLAAVPVEEVESPPEVQTGMTPEPEPQVGPEPVEPVLEPEPDSAPQPEPQAGSAADVLAAMEELALPTTSELVPQEAAAEATRQEADLGRCPRCGAVMRPHQETGQAVCIYCGYGMEEDAGPQVEVTRRFPEVPWTEAGQARRCLTCGTMSISPVHDSEPAPCPACMQSVFEPVLDPYARPDSYLPFQLEEAEAALALEDAGRGGLRRLLRGKPEISRPRRVFLPVWVFSGVGQVSYDFPGVPGHGGVHTETYPALPVHVLPQMDGKLLRLATDAPLEEAVRYDPSAVVGAFVLLPDLALSTAAHDARALMLRDTRQQARDKIRPPKPSATQADQPMLMRGDAFAGEAIASASRGSVMMSFMDSGMQEMQVQLVLLPVWINEVRVGNKLQMGLVNGVTGRAALGSRVSRRAR